LNSELTDHHHEPGHFSIFEEEKEACSALIASRLPLYFGNGNRKVFEGNKQDSEVNPQICQRMERGNQADYRPGGAVSSVSPGLGRQQAGNHELRNESGERYQQKSQEGPPCVMHRTSPGHAVPQNSKVPINPAEY
jgi:hypothetical protein